MKNKEANYGVQKVTSWRGENQRARSWNGRDSRQEIEQVIRKAVEEGINFFDLCGGGKNVYAPFGRAISENRENVYFQMHFGAVYNTKGEYGWSRKFDEIRRTIEWEFETIGTDYADFGFLHCVDEEEDFEKLCETGVFDYLESP